MCTLRKVSTAQSAAKAANNTTAAILSHMDVSLLTICRYGAFFAPLGGSSSRLCFSGWPTAAQPDGKPASFFPKRKLPVEGLGLRSSRLSEYSQCSRQPDHIGSKELTNSCLRHSLIPMALRVYLGRHRRLSFFIRAERRPTPGSTGPTFPQKKSARSLPAPPARRPVSVFP